jgi:hypothetical protein
VLRRHRLLGVVTAADYFHHYLATLPAAEPPRVATA